MIQDDDKLLLELFSDFKPELSSGDAFMDSLNKKLDKVEYIKAVQEAQIHRYKMAVVLSLVCGIVVGGVFSVFILLTPIDVPLFTFTTTNIFLLNFQQYSRLISVVLLSGLLSWGIISIVGMMQEMTICKQNERIKCIFDA